MKTSRTKKWNYTCNIRHHSDAYGVKDENNCPGFIASNEQEGNAQMSHKKAVIIDMMKSVGEIASKIWPAVM